MIFVAKIRPQSCLILLSMTTFQLCPTVRRWRSEFSYLSNCHYLLWQLLLFQSDSQHVGQGSATLLVENVIHKWWALWQDLQAQRDAVHIIICNWLLRQRGLAQVQYSDHDQHGLCNKWLWGRERAELEEQAVGLMTFNRSEERATYILFLFVLNNSNIAQGHFGQCSGQGSCHIEIPIHQEASEWRPATTKTVFNEWLHGNNSILCANNDECSILKILFFFFTYLPLFSKALRSWGHSVSHRCPSLSPASGLELHLLHLLASPLLFLSLSHSLQLGSAHLRKRKRQMSDISHNFNFARYGTISESH